MEIFPLKQHHEQHFYSESHSQLSVLALKRSLEQQLVLGAAPIYVVPVGRSDPRRALSAGSVLSPAALMTQQFPTSNLQ